MTKPTIPMQVVVYFARNPDEELTTQDLQAKFGFDWHVGSHLKHICAQGWVEKVHQGTGPGNPTVYGAGPLLKE